LEMWVVRSAKIMILTRPGMRIALTLSDMWLNELCLRSTASHASTSFVSCSPWR
jgi:hypothetical protein